MFNKKKLQKNNKYKIIYEIINKQKKIFYI